MIARVLTGGQTGVDQAGWRAAKRCGIPTGGWMPAGFLTEAGKRPEFAGLYEACEHTSAQYPPRTEFNVRACDAVLWLGDPGSPGGRLTQRLAQEMEKWPFYVVGLDPGRSSETWLALVAMSLKVNTAHCPYVLLVAGNRESSAPGIGERAEAFCVRLFTHLGHLELTEGHP